MVSGTECSRHIEKNASDMSRAVRIVICFRVYDFHVIISEFEQSSFSEMKFAIGKMQGAKKWKCEEKDELGPILCMRG